MNNSSLNELKIKLDKHYEYFDKSQISPDPLEFPHKYSNENDIEVSAFISSLLAYGNVKQIINSLNKIHKIMGDHPHNYVLNKWTAKSINDLGNFKHRFYSTKDIISMFAILNKIYNEYGSLKNLFLSCFYKNNSDLKSAVSDFSKKLILSAPKILCNSIGLKFMFPDPLKGSACKRMNLFLRWMVRKDELDFGLWNEIPASKLIIPVDTHVATICRKLKLTKRKNVSWKMAEEITANLKIFDADDPVKYDFAICHIGMRKLEF